MGPHLVLLLQEPQGAQALAVVLGVYQGQLLLHPGHLLLSIPAELPEQALGLQGCPALPQGLPQALEPATVEGEAGTVLISIRVDGGTLLPHSVPLTKGRGKPWEDELGDRKEEIKEDGYRQIYL